jgi:ParB family chromosome partitioning protein
MADEGRRRNLGRGLDALLGETRGSSTGDHGSGAGVLTLPIEQVYPGRSQPRTIFAQAEIDELADSIRQLGILQPLIVRPHPTRTGSYEIIAGERRWRAAQQARLHEVPALVRELSDGEALEIALVENLQRENLSPVEEAEAYKRLMDEFAHTQEALAKIVGKSRSHVANMLRLLQLPANAREMLMDGRLTAGHARALLGADNPGALAETIVKRGLNVRQAEKQARGSKPTQSRDRNASAHRVAPAAKDSNTKALEGEISSILGMRVAIEFDDPGGRVSIDYATLEQLDYLLHRLTLGEHGSPMRHPHPPTRRERDEAKTKSATKSDGPFVERRAMPRTVDDAIRQMDEGAGWGDETEPFEFDNPSLDDDLDKLIADTKIDEFKP